MGSEAHEALAGARRVSTQPGDVMPGRDDRIFTEPGLAARRKASAAASTPAASAAAEEVGGFNPTPPAGLVRTGMQDLER